MPSPGIGDVLVEVAAASFTPTELDWPSTWVDRAGRDRTPAIPGHEVSGTVRALGYGTVGFEVGDEVYGLSDWYRDGAAADWVTVEARNLAAKPAALSHVDAAALSLAGLTAWQALFSHGHLEAGQTVVVAGASGGVGTLAVQLGADAGARVVAVAHDWARPDLIRLGAEQVVRSDQLESGKVVDADLLLDLVGGDLLVRSAGMVRTGGTVLSVVESNLKVPSGVDGSFFVVEPDRSQLADLSRLVDAGRVRPIVGKTVPLRDGQAEGFAPKQLGGILGKVVLEVRSG